MTVRNLSCMMKPSSVALIAAAHGPPSVGSVVARNLLNAGFRGEILAVGTEGGGIEGLSSYPDIESLPGAPELAVITAGLEFVPDLVARLGRLGTKAVVVITSGLDADGIGHAQRIRTVIEEAAKPHIPRIVGPGSLGVMAPGIGLNASFAHLQPLKGNLAFVTHSGAVLTSVLDWATSRNIGFSHLISLGGMIDVDFGDMLDYLANDLGTQAILLYVETVGAARKFMSAARLAARMKPVIVLKGCRHAEGACASVTNIGAPAGALADAVCDAAFRRAGMLRVYELQELFDAVETLARARTVPGDRLAILTNGRGIGVLARDTLIDEGGRLAELTPESIARLHALLPSARFDGSPIDIMGDASAARYIEALEILLQDKGTDAVLVLYCPNALTQGSEIARAIVEAMKTGNLKPKANRLLTSWLGEGTAADARGLFIENRIPSYDTPTQAVRGFTQVVRYRCNQEMLMQTPVGIPEAFSPDMGKVQRIVDLALADGRSQLSEAEAKNVLAAYGIPVEPVKRQEYSHELMVGVIEDDHFGPVILFGPGGSAEDPIQDKALALPPLNMHLAQEMMMRTRSYRLLEGLCGTPGANIESVALTLVKVSQLVCDISAIAGLEINPLLADEQGVWAARARIRITGSAAPANQRLAIRPYPKELEETISLPDGHTLLMRPIRAEDEPAYHRLFAGLPPRDVFMRFMSALKVLPHNLAARLTQLDYDREMALVLIGESSSGESELCGGVRISADSDNDRAEFAILLRRDMTGLGLGPLMMQRIIQYARKRGIREIFGDVLSENTPMLKLCKALGFTVKRTLDDPGAVVVYLEL